MSISQVRAGRKTFAAAFDPHVRSVLLTSGSQVRVMIGEPDIRFRNFSHRCSTQNLG